MLFSYGAGHFQGDSPERENFMKKHFKRAAAALFAGILAAGLLAGCGGGGGAASSGGGDGTTITIFNSKMEIQSQLEEKAAEYSEEKGVNVEVYYSSDTVAAHLATRYSSNEPYTLSMVDAKDVYALAEEHALDLSDQEWVGNTTQAISIGDKVYGFPVCVEARGIIYNADAIKNATGEDFDPESVESLFIMVEEAGSASNYARIIAVTEDGAKNAVVDLGEYSDYFNRYGRIVTGIAG